MSWSLVYYHRYFVIGAAVGLSAVLLREVIALLIGDSPGLYLLSIITVYAIGILASFFLHKHITFRERAGAYDGSNAQALSRFTLIALFGMVLTAALAMWFRYALNLDAVFVDYAGAVGFILGNLLSSVATYLLNVRLSF